MIGRAIDKDQLLKWLQDAVSFNVFFISFENHRNETVEYQLPIWFCDKSGWNEAK